MDHPKHDGAPRLGTRAVWSGEQGERWAGATQVSVALSVSFGYRTSRSGLKSHSAKPQDTSTAATPTHRSRL